MNSAESPSWFASTLGALLERRDLDDDTMRMLVESFVSGQCGEVEMAALLVALRMKGETATELAARLLEGEGLKGDPTAPGIIAEQTGGFPYYIHWVVSELRMGGRPAASGDIDLIVKKLLTAPHDPCNLRHFRERIGGYYPKDEKLVLSLLDHAARPGP